MFAWRANLNVFYVYYMCKNVLPFFTLICSYVEEKLPNWRHSSISVMYELIWKTVWLWLASYDHRYQLWKIHLNFQITLCSFVYINIHPLFIVHMYSLFICDEVLHNFTYCKIKIPCFELTVHKSRKNKLVRGSQVRCSVFLPEFSGPQPLVWVARCLGPDILEKFSFCYITHLFYLTWHLYHC